LPPQIFQYCDEPLAPTPFQRVVRTGFERFELPQQLKPVHQECLAGLPAAEILHQLDSAPAPHAEDPLEQGTVQHRYRQGRQLLPNLRNSN